MNPAFQLSLNGVQYSPEDLKAGIRPVRHSEFEKATLAFCHAWLAGQEEFKIETSGSTGQPKEIILHRQQMEASALLTQDAIGLREGYTALLCLDTRFIAGQMMLVRSMVTGMKVVATEPRANPFDKIAEAVDFGAFVPYQLHAILHSAHSRKRLNSMKSVLIGGAALDNPTLKELVEIPCACYASYGMTETISHIALQRLNGSEKQNAFHTLAGISIRLDERGCLLIRAQHLEDREYVTNDLVEITGPGSFRWLGRYDNIINSGGVKVIPEKIERVAEHVLANLKIKNSFFVSALPHETLGQHVFLFVEGNLAADSQREILHGLQQQLPRYETPKGIKLIPVFARTQNGKLDRGATLRLIPA